MLKGNFNLRNKEFRRHLINNTNLSYCRLHAAIFILEKDKITDRDIINFYFEFSEALEFYGKGVYFDFIAALFNYKIGKKDDKRMEFAKLVKNMYSHINIDDIKNDFSYIHYYQTLIYGYKMKFNEFYHILQSKH
jgi:hypothetical protein